MIHHKPTKKMIATYQGGEYIPIEIVQDELDRIYQGRWSDRWFKEPWLITPNALTCALELDVWIDGEKFTHTGSATIELRLGANGYPKGMVDACKNVKSRALSNAARSLGKRLGRHLNKGADSPEYAVNNKTLN